MQAINELIVRTADLCEAEGRLLRAMSVRLACGIAVILTAGAALMAGVALLLGSIYIGVESQGGPAIGALVAGGVALAGGGALLWLGRRIAN